MCQHDEQLSLNCHSPSRVMSWGPGDSNPGDQCQKYKTQGRWILWELLKRRRWCPKIVNVGLGILNCSPQVVLGFHFVGMNKICILEGIMQGETFHVEDAHGPWATWSGGKCHCPWQERIGTGSSARSFPVLPILWFYDFKRRCRTTNSSYIAQNIIEKPQILRPCGFWKVHKTKAVAIKAST